MGFIKFEKLLDETHQVPDRFDYSFAVKRLDNLIQRAPNYSLLCVVGPYGSGKSTALNQLKPKAGGKIWFEFDAWKYPDRKDLWENFVLELARQFDEPTFVNVEKVIDGNQKSDAKALLKTVSGGLNLLIPGAAIIGNLEHFLQTSPATRTYQLQKILTRLVGEKLQGKEALIILEDIDRSGEAGIFFLETLKSYLKTLDNPDVKIKCIVLVAQDKYDQQIDSYLKCTDITEYFRTPIPVLGGFMDELLDDHATTELAKVQITQFCEALFQQHSGQMSPRKLKYILRAANSKYESMELDGLKPDARVAIAVEASRYIRGDSKQTFFKEFLAGQSIGTRPFTNLMTAVVMQCRPDQLSPELLKDFRLNDNTNSPAGNDPRCKPWLERRVASEVYYVHSFYFDY